MSNAHTAGLAARVDGKITSNRQQTRDVLHRSDALMTQTEQIVIGEKI